MALSDRLPALVRTTQQMAALQGALKAARVLSEARPSLVHSGYDNWNGGTDLYMLVLEIPLATYVDLQSDRSELESSILERVRLQTRIDANESFSEVVISPLPIDEPLVIAVEGISSSEDQEPIPAFWQPGYFRLFISHLSEHRNTAHALKESLARYQIAAFVAHDDIQPTTEWQNEIESALRTMDAMTAVLTPGFIMSPWCDQEVGYALGRRRFVLGLRIGADPHGFLGRIQGLQGGGLNAEQIAERIFDILTGNEATTQRMTESLVERLVHSASWEASKRTMRLLEKASHLNSGQVARLLSAIEENVDVGQAFGVPDRIRHLVQRISDSQSE